MVSQLTPKRLLDESAGFGSLFPYYAGFSFKWATAELERHVGSHGTRVLDPWNGGGTTTTAAGSLGLQSIGIDLSPLATMIASARSSAASGVNGSAIARFRAPRSARSREEDPLTRWFAASTAGTLRALTQAAARSRTGRELRWIALFRVVRLLTQHIQGSNPTWVRGASTDSLVEVSPEDLVSRANLALEQLIEEFCDRPLPAFSSPLCLTGDAGKIPLASESVSLVLTSPPYLTRIDYAVAFSRELALLDRSETSLERRRRRLMGTTASRAGSGEQLPSEATFGRVARRTLKAVRSHPSKDSAGYYYRNFMQYFSDLRLALEELDRVTRGGARVGLVVQDSYYKDVPLKLGEIVADEAHRFRWKDLDLVSHPVSRSLVTLNTAARRYLKSDVSEHVLWFETPKDDAYK